MENDQLEEDVSKELEALRNIVEKKGLTTSIAKLLGSSRGVPSQKDFHFYNNFQEFKNPVGEISGRSKYMLQKLGASENLFEKPIAFPDDELDNYLGHDWLENVNDEIFERIEACFAEFKSSEEESGVTNLNEKSLGSDISVGEGEVKLPAKAKQKLPFHIPMLPRPQDVYRINPDNSNQPFQHPLLKRSKDGSRFIHPLEMFCVFDFIDASDDIAEPTKPPPLENVPFKFVEDVKELRQLAIKLRSVDEFSVDLEHNQYRSFQGLTCLMQISTRSEDFVVDTLKLHSQIGPHLREVFKDPSKRKVMHGADHDIFWLQRDFGIYVCNMFDTGQASRVLKMERFSLEYLLRHFCGVAANKEYQNADWRIRPLLPEMIKYGREDTHYLLYIYDLMKKILLASPAESESSDPPLVEVYKRSFNICTRLYEKELHTDTSYLHIYGLPNADFTAQQLAIFSGLVEWRDAIARAEDESPGYVLPNRTLFEIAKQMPLTSSNFHRLLKSKNLYMERNIDFDSVVGVVRNSIRNSAAFEEAVKYIKRQRLELEAKQKLLASQESGVLPRESPKLLRIAESKNKDHNNIPNGKRPLHSVTSARCKDESRNNKRSMSRVGTNLQKQEDKKLEQMNSSISSRILTRNKPLQSDAKMSDEKFEASSHRGPVSGTSKRSPSENVSTLDEDSVTEESVKYHSNCPSNDDDDLARLEKCIADFAAELDDEDDDEFAW